MNLIVIEEHELSETGEVTLSGARGRHLVDVLKVTPGRQLRIGMLGGPLGIGSVTATAPGVTLRCVFEAQAPPVPPVDVMLAVPRPKVMRRLWAQLSALGVGQIILTNAERVERHYFDTHVLEPGVYRPLLIEGLQQARDTRLPSVSIHRQFRVLIEDRLDVLVGHGLRLVAEPTAALSIESALNRGARADVDTSSARVLVAIGPEGGWNAFERALLERHGFVAATMGRRTLRVDTACVALLSRVYGVLINTAPTGVKEERWSHGHTS